ncbi:hypothetical protein [Streptomyces rubrogriseus]|uniref:Uncharacterized protein n=1 Tax=Streptomyces rubrogriseus TaxID=194673 RepID=A0A6G3T694_9ACTN|nr:hypothetical protein [Streptomyces rubrogriseus]NEC31848.1 hypothetical protein [Streptomyces rubrogriseus]
MPNALPSAPAVIEGRVSIVRLHGEACFDCGAVNIVEPDPAAVRILTPGPSRAGDAVVKAIIGLLVYVAAVSVPVLALVLARTPN